MCLIQENISPGKLNTFCCIVLIIFVSIRYVFTVAINNSLNILFNSSHLNKYYNIYNNKYASHFDYIHIRMFNLRKSK
jgi:hypothetical protein